MIREEDEIMRAFCALRFHGEPPMPSTSADDVQRAERHVRRRRVTVLSSGVESLAAVVVATTLLLPGSNGSNPTDADTVGNVDEALPGQDTRPQRLPFPRTRQALVDHAITHFDPAGNHLPRHSANAPNGGQVLDGSLQGNMHVGTKLSWPVPGEEGLGQVSVYVSTAGYATWEPYAVEGFALKVGCDIGAGTCTRQAVPGTDQQAWVADADPQQDLEFSVVLARDDGSLVAVGVYNRFGQNSNVRVPNLAVTLDDAFDFVADTGLRFDPREAASRVDLGPAMDGPP